MADTKATDALTEANYTIKLILGSSPDHEPKAIDISEAVKKAVDYNDIVPSSTSDDFGITYRIVGISESLLDDSGGFGGTESLRTHKARIPLYQSILAILQASIVNAKQYEAVKNLVDSAFDKELDDERQGARYALSKAEQAEHKSID